MIIPTVVLWQIILCAHQPQFGKKNLKFSLEKDCNWNSRTKLILPKRKMELCVICNENAPFKCTACKLVNYCGAEHQKKDWPNHKSKCRPFKIGHSEELGRYLVATRDIPEKSVIFIEPPLVIGPKWCLNEDDKCLPYFPCVGCFKPTPLNGANNCCPK